MRSLLRNNERKNLGRPKMALPSSESSGSDATPMRGNTTAMNVNVKAGEWIDTERRTTESSAKRSLVGRMPLGMHPPPKLSLDPPDPSKAKVKYYHKYKDSSSLSVDKTELKKEKSDGSDKTNLTNNRKIMDVTKLPLEKQLEYYKEKLLQLAKSHAALLATCHQKKRFGKVEIRVKPEHLRNSPDVSRATNQNGISGMKSKNPRRDNSNVLEEVTEEESTQVESTEDQLISFSQLTNNTIDDTKCDNCSKENATMAREATTKGSETCLLNNSPTIRHQDADCKEGTVNNATMLGDDSSFPFLSQESYNTYSIAVPIHEYNQWKDIMQDLHLEGLTDDPPETILQKFVRNNSLMTRQSSMGQEESIFQELDDGQESLGTFPTDATKAVAQPQTTDISVHDASHIGFSQLSQLPVDLHDDSVAEHQEPSQLTQSSTMLDTEKLYSEEHGGSQRFEPRLLSTSASMTGAKSVDLPQQSQLTQTSIDTSVVNAFSPRSDRSPTLNSEKYHANDVSRNAQTSLLSFNPEQDLKAGANSDEDEEETQLEDSQLTQLSLSSSIFHPFRTEQDTRTSLQPVDSEEQTEKLKSLVVEASTKVSDKPPTVDLSQPTKKTVRVGVGVLVKDPLNPNKIFAGTRKGSHGSGELALPGGHLEMFESWEECAIREVKEETDLDIVNVRFGHVTNDIMKEKHYVTIFMLATVKGGAAGAPPQKQTASSSPLKGRKRKSSASGMSLRRSSRARKSRRVADDELFLGDDVEEDFHDSDELVDPESMTPKNMEPDKCEGWGSYSWDDLISRYENNPNCIFCPLRKLLEDKPVAVHEFLNHKIGRSRR